MAKFRCIDCNEPIELSQYRGFKLSEQKCKCSGKLERVTATSIYNRACPVRTLVNNDHYDHIQGKYYFNAWKNSKGKIFVINTQTKFEEVI